MGPEADIQFTLGGAAGRRTCSTNRRKRVPQTLHLLVLRIFFAGFRQLVHLRLLHS